MGLSFLAPLALGALALGALPVLVHMLRRAQTRRLEFPSLRFLAETPSLARALATPRRRALLALRLALVAAIAFAFARPVWTGGPGAAGLARESAVVVIVDASASMRRAGAREAAVAAARDVLQRLGTGDRVRVGAFASELRWLTEMGGADAARRALDGYEPGYGAARYEPAVRDAARELAGAPQPSRRIVLISDFQSANVPALPDGLDPSVGLEPVRVGADFENAFAAGVAVEPGPSGAVASVAAVVAGAGERRASLVTLPLAAGSAAPVARLEAAAGGWRALVTAPDGLDADDARYFVASEAPSVLVCDRGPALRYLVAAAAAAFGDERVESADAPTDALLAGATRALVTERSLAAPGAVDALERWVRAGNVAVVFAAGPTAPPLPRAVGEPGDVEGLVRTGPGVAPGGVDAALLRASVSGARSLEAGPGDGVLLETVGGAPLAVRRPLGAGSAVVVGFVPEPERTALVRDGAFPGFVEWLASGAVTREAEAGSRVAGLAPRSRLTGPGGRALEAGADGAIVATEPGIYRDADGTPLFAANVPLEESEPARLSAEAAAAALAREPAGPGAAPRAVLEETELRQAGWRYALAAALLLLIAELAVVCQRRAPT